MYLNKSNLKNNILNCDQCKVPFNDYDQPRILPCGETICSICLLKIEKKAINQKFNCNLCLNDHSIPDNGFPINKKMCALITVEPMEISRGHEYDQLQNNLNKVQSIVKLVWHDFENGTDIISEYCNEQIRLIQLSTENKIEQINKLSEELIAFVKEYERTCIVSHININKPTIKEDIDKIFQEANTFLNEKQAYSQQYQIDDEEIKAINKTSEDLYSALIERSQKLKSLIFNKRLVKFLSNTKEFGKFELESFDYERLEEPTVFSFYYYQLIKFKIKRIYFRKYSVDL